MRLLYTLTSYPPATGGAQSHQHMLARHMLARHQVQIVTQWETNRTDWLFGTTIRAPADDHDYTIDGVPVHRIGLSLADKLAMAPYLPLYYPLMDLALPLIAHRLEKHLAPYAARADLVHNVRIGREGLSYASYDTARRHDIPFVLTPVHHPRWVGWRYRSYNRLYRLADAVFALTHAEKETLIALGVQEDRITVIGHGPVLAEQADPAAFQQKYQIDGPMVLFLGQHYSYKGYRQLLEAAPLVWQKLPETHFVFIGPAVGNSEQVFAEYSDRRIHRLGTVSLQEKTDALAACALLCMPSTQESFGGVYTEAWTFGKPVIGCNIPAVAEVIEHGVDGLLVAQEPNEIAEAICQLLLNPTQAQAMGIAGQRKAAERYSWASVANRAEAAYLKGVT